MRPEIENLCGMESQLQFILDIFSLHPNLDVDRQHSR